MVSRRVAMAIMLAIATLGVPLGLSSNSTAAQEVTIDCPAPTVASPSPALQPAAVTPAVTPAPFPERGGELTIFAAASLTDAFTAIAADLEAAQPGLAISANFGGSQALVAQLAAGAEADLFASANEAQMDAASQNGSIAGEPVTFAHNDLTIVTPADNPAGIMSPADLGNDGLRLVLAQPEVPAGRYARASLCAMEEEPATYGEGFVARVAANIVSQEEDVRAVLAKVQLGEADAGIVYRSDATAAGDAIQTIPIPAAVNIVAAYPIAMVSGGDEPLAAAFIAYLLGPEGQATLQEFGFAPA